MRLSIGSVVVVLVAEKGRVWVCGFFAENTIRRRRMEIFCKTGGLNLHTRKHGFTFAIRTATPDGKA